MSLEMERESVTENSLEPRDERTLDTVTALIEGLYHDHSGDHAAVIGNHAVITQQYALTQEQWTKALNDANQRYYHNQGYSPADRASDVARMEATPDDKERSARIMAEAIQAGREAYRAALEPQAAVSTERFGDNVGEFARRSEQTPVQTAQNTPTEVRTASLNWLEQEAVRIREASELSVPTAEVELAEAYWSGRRDSFNEAREQMLHANPGLEKDLPAAIEIDEIRVRQQMGVQDQTQGREL
jgi:hypothetical protein